LLLLSIKTGFYVLMKITGKAGIFTGLFQPVVRGEAFSRKILSKIK